MSKGPGIMDMPTDGLPRAGRLMTIRRTWANGRPLARAHRGECRLRPIWNRNSSPLCKHCLRGFGLRKSAG